MKCVRLTCGECGKEFDKPKNEYDRRVRKGVWNFSCSRTCGAAAANKTAPKRGIPTAFRSRGIPDNRRDVFTPFRWFARRIVYRAKKKGYETDVTVEYLKELWEHQSGKCPLNGWDLVLPCDSDTWSDDSPFGPRSASVDRIDNSKGYIQGNVRFISIMANYARNVFTDEEVIEFANAVVEYQNKKSTI